MPETRPTKGTTMLLPPKFYDATMVKAVQIERAALVAESADGYRRTHGIKAAAEDKFRIAAFGIDAQIGFCTPGASLYVPGAVEDTQRAIEWIFRNLDRITQLCFSLDTHRVFQIFHPSWWVDAEGRHPAPFTPITLEDVRKGRYRPTQN